MVLEKLVGEQPLPGLTLEYRKLEKLLNDDFLARLAKLAGPMLPADVGRAVAGWV